MYLREPTPGAIIRFGVFELNTATGELRKSGVLIHLSPQPAKVLAIITANAAGLVTREQLRALLWGTGTFVDFEQGLNHCIRPDFPVSYTPTSSSAPYAAGRNFL